MRGAYITNTPTMWHEDDQDPEVPFLDDEDEDEDEDSEMGGDDDTEEEDEDDN
mgnify:CR=1 FL=1|jgi:hypothetical protein